MIIVLFTYKYNVKAPVNDSHSCNKGSAAIKGSKNPQIFGIIGKSPYICTANYKCLQNEYTGNDRTDR